MQGCWLACKLGCLVHYHNGLAARHGQVRGKLFCPAQLCPSKENVCIGSQLLDGGCSVVADSLGKGWSINTAFHFTGKEQGNAAIRMLVTRMYFT